MRNPGMANFPLPPPPPPPPYSRDPQPPSLPRFVQDIIMYLYNHFAPADQKQQYGFNHFQTQSVMPAVAQQYPQNNHHLQPQPQPQQHQRHRANTYASHYPNTQGGTWGPHPLAYGMPPAWEPAPYYQQQPLYPQQQQLQQQRPPYPQQQLPQYPPQYRLQQIQLQLHQQLQQQRSQYPQPQHQQPSRPQPQPRAVNVNHPPLSELVKVTEAMPVQWWAGRYRAMMDWYSAANPHTLLTDDLVKKQVVARTLWDLCRSDEARRGFKEFCFEMAKGGAEGLGVTFS